MERFRDARRGRYLARIVAKAGNRTAGTPVVEFRQAADDVPLSD